MTGVCGTAEFGLDTQEIYTQFSGYKETHQAKMASFLLTPYESALSRLDDDHIDQLNHHVTTGMLAMFALVLTMAGTDYLSAQKMVCWTPIHFSKYQNNYVKNYRWVKNTYTTSHLLRSESSERTKTRRVRW